ncbi:aKG-HExxH-type peptide beta-hydroxylase [Nocardia salmonicida]|uniref:aKG-HExxH-type peptide beta-hydroxylase n=1 Tax=Nocardia salmonicida TaxID=53431 RepID=UPI003718DF52
MDELTDTFRFDRTTDLHRARVHAIHAVLSNSTKPKNRETHASAMDYALAHHFLEGAEVAARCGDGDTLKWYRNRVGNPPLHWFAPTVLGPAIVQSPNPTSLRRSPIADTPYHLLNPDNEPPSLATVQLASDAYEIAAELGFGGLLAAHAPIMCLLVERKLDEPLNSWAISRLPGTVFCDHVGDPTILARDLIHEAGHNWLNDALTATGVDLDDGNTWHSPWKNTPRPTFGFIHSCWAFPLTMLFAARAADHANRQVRRVLATYLVQHRQKLAVTNLDHDRAAAAVTDRDLRQRLRVIHSLASQL